MKHKLLKTLLLLLAITVAGVLYLGHLCRIPPASATITSIGECAVRTQMFYHLSGTFPPSLASLPERAGYANSIVDGYGRELIFKTLPDRMVFISYGKDGVPGGSGKDADIEIHYMTHKPDGTVWIGDPDWISEAKRRIQSPY